MIYRVVQRYDKTSYEPEYWDFVYGKFTTINNLEGAKRKFINEIKDCKKLEELKMATKWMVTLEVRKFIFWKVIDIMRSNNEIKN